MKSAPTDQVSARELAALTFKPFLQRIDAFLQKSKLGRLNIQPEELFDSLWMGGMATAMRTVDFNDRTHYFNTFLLRAKNLAQRLAKTSRSRSQHTISLAVEHAESVRAPADNAADMQQIASLIKGVSLAACALEGNRFLRARDLEAKRELGGLTIPRGLRQNV